MKYEATVQELAESLLKHERRSLAKAISLVESTRDEDFRQSQELLSLILPHTGNSLRIGITGVPGVGKSTLIESFGLLLTAKGHRVAVLAIDPSSKRSGGSILGDKVRMARLSREQSAFIRPSPAGTALGGVARRTRETILLCEAAGFDIILVETVGVGQSETELASLVDFFIMLMLPNAGDEIQGIKRGIMEMADLLVVTKSDGEQRKAAEQAKRRYQSALRFMMPKYESWTPKVLLASGLEGSGLEEIYGVCSEFREPERQPLIREIRRQQNREWLHRIIDDELHRMFYENPQIRGSLRDAEEKVVHEQTLPTSAALELLDMFRRSK